MAAEVEDPCFVTGVDWGALALSRNRPTVPASGTYSMVAHTCANALVHTDVPTLLHTHTHRSQKDNSARGSAAVTEVFCGEISLLEQMKKVWRWD